MFAVIDTSHAQRKGLAMLRPVATTALVLTSLLTTRYGDVVPLVSLLARSGFVDVTVTDWRQALPIGDRLPAPDAAQFALASFSSFAELLSNAGGDAPTRARRALAARFTPYEQEGTVLMPARIHIITGRAGEP
jgi:hypothetical protein